MTHPRDQTPSREPRRRFSPVGAIALYGTARAALAAVLYTTALRGTEPLARPELEWWAIALGWVIAESCVVHLHF